MPRFLGLIGTVALTCSVVAIAADPATPPAPSFTATPGDSGQIYLAWSDLPAASKGDQYVIERYTGKDAKLPDRSFEHVVESGIQSYVDVAPITPGSPKLYSYVLSRRPGQGGIAPTVIAEKSATQSLAMTRFYVYDGDRTKWQERGFAGTWSATKSALTQTDDEDEDQGGKVSEKKSFLTGLALKGDLQITTRVALKGWTADVKNKKARIGIGLYANPKDGKGFFLTFTPDVKATAAADPTPKPKADAGKSVDVGKAADDAGKTAQEALKLADVAGKVASVAGAKAESAGKKAIEAARKAADPQSAVEAAVTAMVSAAIAEEAAGLVQEAAGKATNAAEKSRNAADPLKQGASATAASVAKPASAPPSASHLRIVDDGLRRMNQELPQKPLSPVWAGPDQETRFWLRLKVVKNGNLATISGYFWPDGQVAEQKAQVGAQDWDWTVDAATEYYAALNGGIAGEGNGVLKVAFENVMIEAAGSTTTASEDLPGPGHLVDSHEDVEIPRLVPPEPGDYLVIPSAALQCLRPGRFGALIGYEFPEGPVRIACPPHLCDLRMPISSFRPVCGHVACAARGGACLAVPTSWPIVPGPDGLPQPGIFVETQAPPIGASPAGSPTTILPSTGTPDPVGGDGLELYPISSPATAPGLGIRPGPARAGAPSNDPARATTPVPSSGSALSGRRIITEGPVRDPDVAPIPAEIPSVRPWVRRSSYEPQTGPQAPPPLSGPADARQEKETSGGPGGTFKPVVPPSPGSSSATGIMPGQTTGRPARPAFVAPAERPVAPGIGATVEGTIAPRSSLLRTDLVRVRDLRDQGAVATTPDPAPLTASEIDRRIKVLTRQGEILRKKAEERRQLETALIKEQKNYFEILDKISARERGGLPRDDQMSRELEAARKSLDESTKRLADLQAFLAPAGLAEGLVGDLGGGTDECDDRRPPRDPFSFVPRVSVIRQRPPLRCRQGEDMDEDGQPDNPFYRETPPEADWLRDDKDGRVWTYHFDLPARFPANKFGGACCGFEGEGVVIHEGMRMLAKTDGQYEIRLNLSAPPMPVTLRLQMLLYSHGARPPRTLTLPPIVLMPSDGDSFDDDLAKAYDPVSYLVAVRGYSQVIKEQQRPATPQGPPASNPGYFALVKRTGVARFGSGVRYQTNR
jgi:hypothetical protein